MEVQDLSMSTGNPDFCEILYTTLIVTLRERSPILFSDLEAFLIDSHQLCWMQTLMMIQQNREDRSSCFCGHWTISVRGGLPSRSHRFWFFLPCLVSVLSYACFLEICLMGQLVSGLLLVLPRLAHLLSCIMSCQGLLVPPACLDKICPVHEHTRVCWPGHP